MFFLKTRQSVGIYPIWCLTRWSSGISDNSNYKELLEHISKQDKVKSEQFRALLPCIQEINKSPPSYKLSAADKKLQQTPLSELTNILDTAPETDNAVSSSNNEDNSNEKSARDISIEETPADCPPVDTLSATEEQPPKSLPVLISSFETKRSCFQWDLGSVALPISLHRGEDNFLAVAVAKDIKHAYYKTLETTDHWRTAAQQVALHQPGAVGSTSLEKAITLVEQSSLWLCQPKPSAASAPKTPKSEESLVDKIKMALEKMLSLLKAKLEELKKERDQKDQKKAEEQKKEAKAE